MQILPSFLATANLRRPVFELGEKLSSTCLKLVIIYDSVMTHVVQDIYSVPNAESYCFQRISAFSLYSFIWEASGKPALSHQAQIFKDVPSIEGCFPDEFNAVSEMLASARKFNTGDIFNTSRLIEGFYVDLIGKEKKTGIDECWALGPFNPVLEKFEKKQSDDKILKWLDKQGIDNSVIFVSFGTTSCLSDEQIFEIAFGLEKSEQRFVWVLREADKGDVFEGDVRRAPLPDGFELRVKERGLIVRDWAPQLEILGHPSIGLPSWVVPDPPKTISFKRAKVYLVNTTLRRCGFISHCGWNSCMESISMGVPIIAWPMHSDQPKNAFLMTEVLKIGIQIKDWARHNEIISSDEVKKSVRRLMALEEGDEVRKKATKIGGAVRESLMEGGVTSKEMDSFIARISRQTPS
ncbi:hypothetical protein CASFOL_025476 [Castilleja foliolosa]|uniref:Glycosyltransferase N-terminal domain-containing protein n=1 Tax=Castilleja foliolosa TaxID=1961234 RepID=A0ABD3CV96_9LAMI